jgi:hypothetical protein
MQAIGTATRTLARQHLDPGFRLDPDYTQHAAYGQFFPPPLSTRVRALRRFVPWLVFVAVKRCFQGDRLPALTRPDGSIPSGVAGRVRVTPRWLLLVWRNAMAGRGYDRKRAAGNSALEELRHDGIVIRDVPEDVITDLRRETAAPFRELTDRRERGGVTVFEEAQNWLTQAAYPELYERATQMLRRIGALEAASGYLGREASLIRLLVQINDARDRFTASDFDDIEIPKPPTVGMHLDTTYGVLKCMIYLTEVQDTNGPFCYVLGSHQIRQSWFEGLVRRAVERSGLARLDGRSRRVFSALPACFRKKCTIGGDWTEGATECQQLMDAEYRWTSADGNFALFDNLGIHRGGQVREGQRRVLFAVLA